MSDIHVPKGTRDLSGAEVAAFVELESTARRVYEQFSFTELRTPIFEHAELFSRAMGDTSEIAENMAFHMILGMWMGGWGYEISESFVVTATGADCLTHLPRSLHVVS